MFWFIKQVFMALLSFSGSLATKCVTLNNEPGMIGLTFIDFVKLNYYPFMVNLDKCSGSCNAADELSIITCVPNKTKDINVKVFNMITRINGAKTLIKHVSCDYKCNLNSTTCNSNENE